MKKIMVIISLLVLVSCSSYNGNDGQRQSCIDNGGQVIEDKYGVFDGCILP